MSSYYIVQYVHYKSYKQKGVIQLSSMMWGGGCESEALGSGKHA